MLGRPQVALAHTLPYPFTITLTHNPQTLTRALLGRPQVALANLDAVLQEARGALEALPSHCLAALEAALRRRLPPAASVAPAAQGCAPTALLYRARMAPSDASSCTVFQSTSVWPVLQTASRHGLPATLAPHTWMLRSDTDM